MKTIYTFGDSHTCMFQDQYPRPGFVPPMNSKVIFRDLSNISSTAYNLSEHDSEVRGILSSIEFKPEDEIWFVFGEIDVRFQVFYQQQQRNITVDQSIDNLVTRYIGYVKSLVDLEYPIKIVSITPTQLNKVPHRHDPLHHLTMLNPVRGEGITVTDRIYATKELNKRIQAKCESFGIGFINLYPYLVDHDTECIKMSITKDNGMHCYYIGDLIINWFNLEGDNNG